MMNSLWDIGWVSAGSQRTMQRQTSGDPIITDNEDVDVRRRTSLRNL
jgi:hypothetical protein